MARDARPTERTRLLPVAGATPGGKPSTRNPGGTPSQSLRSVDSPAGAGVKRTDLVAGVRRDPRGSRGVPGGRPPRCRRLHRVRHTPNRHRDGRRPGARAAGQDVVRIRLVDRARQSSVVGGRPAAGTHRTVTYPVALSLLSETLLKENPCCRHRTESRALASVRNATASMIAWRDGWTKRRAKLPPPLLSSTELYAQCRDKRSQSNNCPLFCTPSRPTLVVASTKRSCYNSNNNNYYSQLES